MVYVKSVFKKYSVENMAREVYGDDDTVSEFMDNGHRGEIAKFVLGDENEFVFPRALNDEQTERLKEYLESVQYLRPAPMVSPA